MSGITQEEIFAALDERHGEAVRRKLWDSRVAIAGLGGLGSNVAVALTRAGVGKLRLIDFDVVDITNLNRQMYFTQHIGRKKTEALPEILRSINPFIEIEAVDVRLDESNTPAVLGGCSVICEAFDKAESKAVLVNTVLEKLPEAKLVSGTGLAGYGRSNEIATRRVTDRFYVCGDEVSGIEKGLFLMAPRVAICAGHEANKIIELLLG